MNGKFLRVTDPYDNNRFCWLAFLENTGEFEYMWCYDKEKGVFWRNHSLKLDYYGLGCREMIRMKEYQDITYSEFIEFAKDVRPMHQNTRDNFIRRNTPAIPESDILGQFENMRLVAA